MAMNPRNSKILNVFFLTFCFASSLVFSGYCEMDEADCFNLNPVFENLAPSIHCSVEKSPFVLFPGNSHYHYWAFFGIPPYFLEISSFFSGIRNNRFRC